MKHPKPNVFQMAPIDHIICIGCVQVPRTTLFCFTIVGSMTQIIFCSSALISAEMQEYAADAQMWCHFNAPSLEDKPPASRLPPYGFPYDIQSSGWEPIMG